ncbi:MAG: prohibitin family protein [Chloroflexota bacterium]|nr:prohibitin family protein [Chloroflexota bacterium]MDE2854037.1 prohibitin family protein [Chloroflexota bacterium]MDE2948140.1 prohibitin family protein [Chloroflexota bacterium]
MNFGGLLGIVAVLAFGVGILGVAFAFTLASQGRSSRGGVLLALFGFAAGVVLFVVSSGILIVQPARAAVIVNVLTGELEQPARAPGTSIIIPGLQEYIIYPTDQREYTMSGISSEGRLQGNDAVEALTADGQEVKLDITVLYRIDRADVNQIHLNWQNRFEADFIRPTVRAEARDVVSKFEAESIYGEGREAMGTDIFNAVEEHMKDEGLTLTSLLVRQIDFTDAFANSIEEKQIEDQKLQRARTEAERVQTEAGGRADALEQEARGRANARLIEAQAEAEALRVISDQIAANPNLIQYLYVANLSDNVSFALLPSDSPFIFSVDDFTQLGDDFQAPEASVQLTDAGN